jgi:hypothetical protein
MEVNLEVQNEIRLCFVLSLSLSSLLLLLLLLLAPQ